MRLPRAWWIQDGLNFRIGDSEIGTLCTEVVERHSIVHRQLGIIRAMVNPAVVVSREELAELCRRRQVRWLAFFGSVLTDEFRADSDIDVLVEFEPGHMPGLAIIDIEDELSALLGGRRVDLILREELSRWIRDRVLAEAGVQYAEG